MKKKLTKLAPRKILKVSAVIHVKTEMRAKCKNIAITRQPSDLIKDGISLIKSKILRKHNATARLHNKTPRIDAYTVSVPLKKEKN